MTGGIGTQSTHVYIHCIYLHSPRYMYILYMHVPKPDMYTYIPIASANMKDRHSTLAMISFFLAFLSTDGSFGSLVL